MNDDDALMLATCDTIATGLVDNYRATGAAAAVVRQDGTNLRIMAAPGDAATIAELLYRAADTMCARIPLKTQGGA